MINIENITIPNGKIMRCPYLQKEDGRYDYALCGYYYCTRLCPYFSYKEITYNNTIIGCKYASYAEAVKNKKIQKKHNNLFDKIKKLFKFELYF